MVVETTARIGGKLKYDQKVKNIYRYPDTLRWD